MILDALAMNPREPIGLHQVLGSYSLSVLDLSSCTHKVGSLLYLTYQPEVPVEQGLSR
jgi:hypothetical protein